MGENVNYKQNKAEKEEISHKIIKNNEYTIGDFLVRDGISLKLMLTCGGSRC